MHEIAAFMGHAADGGITGHYNNYLRELAPLVRRPILEPLRSQRGMESVNLRAHCVPIPRQSLSYFGGNTSKNMVGVTGFEPATYTSRT